MLAELGAYITDPAHAPAGTKRLSNLLRSPKWRGRVIEQYLWEQAMAQVDEQTVAGAPVYAALEVDCVLPHRHQLDLAAFQHLAGLQQIE